MTQTKNTMTHPGYTKTGDGFFIKSSLLPANNRCHRCEETDFSPNIEAFEICGQLTCDECAEEVFEENSQFGAGA